MSAKVVVLTHLVPHIREHFLTLQILIRTVKVTLPSWGRTLLVYRLPVLHKLGVVLVSTLHEVPHLLATPLPYITEFCPPPTPFLPVQL